MGAGQLTVADAVLRGFGAAVVKSRALLSVSVQPFALRKPAVVLLNVGVGPEPSKQFVVEPKPTKSTTEVGQEPESAPVDVTSATFPAPNAIAIVPVASGVGRLTVPPLPAAS